MKVYKAIEKLAWLTGSLSLVGLILILFLQGRGKDLEKHGEHSETKRPVLKFVDSRIPVSKKPANPIVAEVSEPIASEPKSFEEKKIEIAKPIEKEVKVTPEEKLVTKAGSERKAVSRDDLPLPDDRRVETTNRLFAESELDQMIGKIQAQRITNKSASNCVQLRITADNNNAAGVAQVERMLASKNYIIIGREKEDFLKGSGITVKSSGNCIRITVGRK